jgi:predicted ATPase
MIAEYLKTQAMLGDTQFIVTTHSPILLDMLPEDSLYLFKKNKKGHTNIEHYQSEEPKDRKKTIEEALNGEPYVPLSQKVLREELDV